MLNAIMKRCNIFLPGLAVLLAVLLAAASSCSSAPKRPTEVFTIRNMASGQLELAAQAANHGRYNDALLILEDVIKSATSVDNPPLVIKTNIVIGNVVFAIGRHDEAFFFWNLALEYANKAGEKNLASQARIYAARGRIILLAAENSNSTQQIEDIRAQVNSEIASLKGDQIGEAAGWVAVGLAEKELRRYTEAEASVKKAVAIHEKLLYLEETAYDWYLIASIRSVSQRYNEAIEALNTSISFDRRAENGFGLASSWHSMGDVYAKAGNTAEANAAYLHAVGIYNSLGMEEEALTAEAKIKQ